MVVVVVSPAHRTKWGVDAQTAAAAGFEGGDNVGGEVGVDVGVEVEDSIRRELDVCVHASPLRTPPPDAVAVAVMAGEDLA